MVTFSLVTCTWSPGQSFCSIAASSWRAFTLWSTCPLPPRALDRIDYASLFETVWRRHVSRIIALSGKTNPWFII